MKINNTFLSRLLYSKVLFTLSLIFIFQCTYAQKKPKQNHWKDFKFESIGNTKTVKITGHHISNSDKSRDLVIPDKINGRKVVEIDNKAFFSFPKRNNGKGYVKFSGRLYLPKYLKKIGVDAFRKNDFKGEILLPNSLDEIGYKAFNENNFTGDLTIPRNVKKIAEGAFSQNKLDGYLFINSNKLITISKGTFEKNSFTGNLNFPSGLKEIQDNAFRNAFKSDQQNGTLLLPSTLNTIGKEAFKGNNFSGTLVLPSNLSSVGNAAFSNNRFTGKLTIPPNLTVIKEKAFENNLWNEVEIRTPSARDFQNKIFSNNANLSSIAIPCSISLDEFPYDAFSGTKIQLIMDPILSGNIMTGYRDVLDPNKFPLVLGHYNGKDIDQIKIKGEKSILFTKAQQNNHLFYPPCINSIDLPIELSHFDVLDHEENVEIIWTTTQEINNSHFILEKSNDNRSYELLSAKIQGAGNSNVENQYSFIDKSPLKGRIYYRLTQVDFDGNKETWTKIIEHSGHGMEKVVSVYPNPANYKLNIALNLTQDDIATYQFTDVSSGLVIDATPDNTSSRSKVTFNVSTFHAGTYILTVKVNHTVAYSGKVIIVSHRSRSKTEQKDKE